MSNHNFVNINDGLFAVWTVESFPYILGGNIISINEVGNVQVKQFEGYSLVPVKILPTTTGEGIMYQLEDMKSRRFKEIEEINKKFDNELDKYLQKFGIHIDGLF